MSTEVVFELLNANGMILSHHSPFVVLVMGPLSHYKSAPDEPHFALAYITKNSIRHQKPVATTPEKPPSKGF